MSQSREAELEQRVLIFAPVGKDASLMASMLETDGFPCRICADVGALAEEFAQGAAVIVLTEEAIRSHDRRLASLIAGQPRWSDVPVLLLTRPGSNSKDARWAQSMLGNVTLIERPVRIAGLTSAVRSATRARARQYLTRAHVEEREQADRRKDEFLATLAHELRNPLAPIRNAVHVLRLSQTDGSPAAALGMMDRQIDHMVRLVDDLMEVSRITRGKIELRREPVELAQVVKTAVEACRPMIDAAGHELVVTSDPRPLTVEGDAVRLSQVVSNLLNNAVKYTDPGGRITLDVQRIDGEAIVTVSDNGIGMTTESLRNVFDMFVQADERNQRTKAGLGIGLTLVRSLVEMHGGRISAHSEGLGRGSEFSLRLRLLEHETAPDADRTHAIAGGIRGLPRVLVVDDNHDAADTLGAVLQMLGADVRVAHDGPAALEEVDSFRPAAVFLDLGMPGMDGYEVASRMRSKPEGPEIRLIAVTGWGQEKDRERTREAGFDGHLVKPPDLTALQDVLASL